jgi:hypothetical protein
MAVGARVRCICVCATSPYDVHAIALTPMYVRKCDGACLTMRYMLLTQVHFAHLMPRALA